MAAEAEEAVNGADGSRSKGADGGGGKEDSRSGSGSRGNYKPADDRRSKVADCTGSGLVSDLLETWRPWKVGQQKRQQKQRKRWMEQTEAEAKVLMEAAERRTTEAAGEAEEVMNGQTAGEAKLRIAQVRVCFGLGFQDFFLSDCCFGFAGLAAAAVSDQTGGQAHGADRPHGVDRWQTQGQARRRADGGSGRGGSGGSSGGSSRSSCGCRQEGLAARSTSPARASSRQGRECRREDVIENAESSRRCGQAGWKVGQQRRTGPKGRQQGREEEGHQSKQWKKRGLAQ